VEVEIFRQRTHVDSSLVLILGLSDASADQGDDCEKSDLHVEILSVRQEMNGLECVCSVCEGSRGYKGMWQEEERERGRGNG